MSRISNIINPLAIMVSITTATGVFIHDNNLDSLAAALTMPAIVIGAGVVLDNSTHPHAAEHSLTQATRDLEAQSPHVRPRDGRERGYRLANKVPKGRHPFDNYSLPLIN